MGAGPEARLPMFTAMMAAKTAQASIGNLIARQP